jgi:uncharacterized protein (DUF1330 family)
MTAYVVVTMNITDQEPLMEYVGRIGKLLEKHGGRYLVRGEPPEVIHGGDNLPERLVVLEFPDMATARAFFEERKSLGLADLFSRGTDSAILLAEGV